jgi:hypothetical protein
MSVPSSMNDPQPTTRVALAEVYLSDNRRLRAENEELRRRLAQYEDDWVMPTDQAEATPPDGWGE